MTKLGDERLKRKLLLKKKRHSAGLLRKDGFSGFNRGNLVYLKHRADSTGIKSNK